MTESSGEERSIAHNPGTDEVPRVRVTSAEFVRHFGNFRQEAGDHPIHVTHHGRDTHVFLTAAHYEELSSRAAAADRKQESDTGLPSLRNFADLMNQGVLIVDDDLTIHLSNRRVRTMIGRDAARINDRHLLAAVPELYGSLFMTYVQRALDSRDFCTADIPSIARRGGWIRLTVIPGHPLTTILVTDITDDVRINRLADVKAAMATAMQAQGEIFLARVNPRGHIEMACEGLCRLLRLPQERLHQMTLIDLVTPTERAVLREALDDVLDHEVVRLVEFAFTANDGTSKLVKAAIAPLTGIYGSEGAVMIGTPKG